eukprot:1140855-Pelagomonas_calceolata.AAC.1
MALRKDARPLLLSCGCSSPQQNKFVESIPRVHRPEKQRAHAWDIESSGFGHHGHGADCGIGGDGRVARASRCSHEGCVSSSFCGLANGGRQDGTTFPVQAAHHYQATEVRALPSGPSAIAVH